MTKERRNQILLGALVLILTIVLGRTVLGLFGGGTGGVAVSRSRIDGPAGSVTPVERVRVAELELEPETFKLGRDPFQFAVAAPKPVATPAPAPVRTPNPRPTPAPPPRRAAPPAPQPPPVDVVYLGRFGATSRPIAVFSDGKEIFNAFEGGVLKGNFVVDKIGYESADLKFVGFPDAPAKRLAVGG